MSYVVSQAWELIIERRKKVGVSIPFCFKLFANDIEKAGELKGNRQDAFKGNQDYFNEVNADVVISPMTSYQEFHTMCSNIPNNKE